MDEDAIDGDEEAEEREQEADIAEDHEQDFEDLESRFEIGMDERRPLSDEALVAYIREFSSNEEQWRTLLISMRSVSHQTVADTVRYLRLCSRGRWLY